MSNEIEYKEINTSTISSEGSLSSSQQNSRELELSERVAQLEKKLDEALMLISDIYRYGKLRDLLSAGPNDELAAVLLG